MKNRTLFGCFLAAISFSAMPYFVSAQANNSNGDNIDVTFVRFNMFVDPTLASTDPYVLNGSVTHYFKTEVANVQKIKFDFYRDQAANRLVADSFRYHGVKYTLAAAKHSNDTLIIDLPTAITATGTLDSVTIFYHGNPPQSNGSRGYKKNTTGTTLPNEIISTHSSGFFARQWWPCKHNMTDKIDNGVEFLITAPSAYKAVANGLLQNGPTPPTVGGNKTWHWKSNYAIAHYLIAFAVHNYIVYNSPSATVSGTTVPIVNYLTAATNTTTIKSACDAMSPVLEHYSSLFGDYPFKNEKYGHVAYTFGGGMENQTGSFIGTGAFDKSILAHELAHQWWGDKVTCLKWNHNWVNESFARYAEILYSEEFETAADAITKRASYKAATGVKSATNTIYRYDVEVVNDATDHTGKIFVSSMVYDKGAIVVSMLRKLVGDVKFFQALKNYLNDPLISYGYAATEDVRRHFEAVSGRDLTDFFNDFIYKSGYPTYNVQWAYSASHKKVAIKLNQTKASTGTYALSGRFHTVIPIRLRKTTAPVRDTTIIVYDDGVASLSTMLFNVSFAVDAISIDPDSESYSYDNTSSPTPALVATLASTLTRFEATKQNNAIRIEWESVKENGLSHYELEHSKDGAFFEKIANLPARHLDNNKYSYLHSAYLGGNNYYRLKMVDMDGSSAYSYIVNHYMQEAGKISISPNPARGVVKILLPFEVKKDVTVSLTNLQGQSISLKGGKTAINTIELNISSIPQGSYWIELQLEGRKVTERILVQR